MKFQKKSEPKSKAVRKSTKMAYEKAKNTSKLGTGKRFSALSKSLEAEGYSPKSAGAISASIGRKKYGNKKMASMSKSGNKY